MCAALGLLNRQSSRSIIFARPPKSLRIWDGAPAFGKCSGYTDKRCDERFGFANDDIFYLEVCLYSQVCSNRNDLFSVEPGSPFICDVSVFGFRHLQELLIEGPGRI